MNTPEAQEAEESIRRCAADVMPAFQRSPARERREEMALG